MERRTRQAGVCGGSGNKREALRGSYYSTDRGQRRHFYLLLRILVGILIFTWDSMNTWYLYYPPPPKVSCVPLVLTEQGWQLWETGASISCSSGILSASCTEKRGGCTLLPPPTVFGISKSLPWGSPYIFRHRMYSLSCMLLNFGALSDTSQWFQSSLGGFQDKTDESVMYYFWKW